jgi:hypothetical protein
MRRTSNWHWMLHGSDESTLFLLVDSAIVLPGAPAVGAGDSNGASIAAHFSLMAVDASSWPCFVPNLWSAFLCASGYDCD